MTKYRRRVSTSWHGRTGWTYSVHGMRELLSSTNFQYRTSCSWSAGNASSRFWHRWHRHFTLVRRSPWSRSWSGGVGDLPFPVRWS